MIKICKVVNYEEVSKILNLFSSQKPHSISPLFHPISPQICLHFALIPSQFSFNFTHSLHQSHPLHPSTGTILYIPLRDD